MSVLSIVTLGDPRLRLPGEPVRRFDRGLHRLLADMVDTMREAPGVGLAAQQVGHALQVCVIEIDDELHELVNPRIVHLEGDQLDWEGCLSIPGFYAQRPRSERAVIEGLDRRGRPVRVSGTGLLARAIQHEYDHLQGELYVDGLPPGTDLVPVSRMREQAAIEAGATGEVEVELARPA